MTIKFLKYYGFLIYDDSLPFLVSIWVGRVLNIVICSGRILPPPRRDPRPATVLLVSPPPPAPVEGPCPIEINTYIGIIVLVTSRSTAMAHQVDRSLQPAVVGYSPNRKQSFLVFWLSDLLNY